jgi:predicted lipoprotein with Yx(FWY)xxD motif
VKVAKRSVLLAATVAAAFVAAACGSNPYSSAPTAASTPATAPPAAASPATDPYGANPSPATAPLPGTATVMLTSSSLGQILVDANGRTLYLWEVDKTAKSNCYDACRNAWPPVLTTGKPLAGMGISQGLLGTSARTDGQLEVVYNGHPLYYFIADKKAGDTTGQGINNFGGPWYVLSASGNKIDKS